MDKDFIEQLLKRNSARLVYNCKTMQLVGEFTAWRKENPHLPITMDSEHGTFEIGAITFGLSKYDKECLTQFDLWGFTCGVCCKVKEPM